MTNVKIILAMLFIIIFSIVILYKDMALADSETKNKKWFKVYVIYMKIAIGIMTFTCIEGIMTNLKYW